MEISEFRGNLPPPRINARAVYHGAARNSVAGPVTTHFDRCDDGHFCAAQGERSEMYLTYLSDDQRSAARKWPRPVRVASPKAPCGVAGLSLAISKAGDP